MFACKLILHKKTLPVVDATGSVPFLLLGSNEYSSLLILLHLDDEVLAYAPELSWVRDTESIETLAVLEECVRTCWVSSHDVSRLR